MKTNTEQLQIGAVASRLRHGKRGRVAAIAAGLIGAAAVGGVVLTRADSQPSKKGGVTTIPVAAPSLRVQTITVRTERNAGEGLQVSGQVRPWRVATLAAEVPARVVSRPIEKGARIKAGQVVALLDGAAASASVDQARASLANARAGRRQIESEYARTQQETGALKDQARAQSDAARAQEERTRTITRIQEQKQADAALAQAQADERIARIETDRYTFLVKEGALAKQILDRAQATLDAAIARRQSAEQVTSLAREGARPEDVAAASAQTSIARAAVRAANARPARLAALRAQIDGLRAQEAQALAALRAAQIHLGKHRLVAPFAGRVLETPVEAGEMVAPQTPVVKIGALGQVKATFAVPEAARARLRDGQTLRLTADTLPGETFTGRIHVLGVEADARSRAFPIEVVIANPSERLLPNMALRLTLPPLFTSRPRPVVPVASVATEGGTYVLLLEQGRAVRRAVTLGSPSGVDSVVITSGLRGGETLIATPQRITDGAPVLVAGGTALKYVKYATTRLKT